MPAWTIQVLHGAEILSPAFLFVSIVVPVDFLSRRRRWALWGFCLIVIQCLADALGLETLSGLVGLAIVVASLRVLARGVRDAWRIRAAWIERFNAGVPLQLQPPFEGRWKGLNTGPWTATNHHLAARDQWFAVDWVRKDQPSRGSRILAPVDGVVAYIEDGHPDKPGRRWIQRDLDHPGGNYVSIQLAGRASAYVILAHLEMGSVAVRVGQPIRVGELVGRCGNSGNTSIPHLHMHAQQGERFAPGASWGIPVVFGAELTWVEPGKMIDAQAEASGLGLDEEPAPDSHRKQALSTEFGDCIQAGRLLFSGGCRERF